jgi:cell division cycle protein 20 (cofactor of APC complex)
VLAIALSRTVFLWNATTSQIHKLVELEGGKKFIRCPSSTSAGAYLSTEDLVTSVTWLCDGSYLAVGTNSADVNIYDAQALKVSLSPLHPAFCFFFFFRYSAPV